MESDLSTLGVLVRASAAALYVALGLLILILGRKSTRAVGLGVFLVASGIGFILLNLGSRNPALPLAVPASLAMAVGIAGAAVLLRHELRRIEGSHRAPWIAIGLAGATTLAGSLLLYSGRTQGGYAVSVAWPPTEFWIFTTLFGAGSTMAALCAICMMHQVATRPRDSADKGSPAFLAFLVVAHPAFVAPLFVAPLATRQDAGTLGVALLAGFGFVAAFWAVVATRGPSSRSGRNLAVAIMACSLAGVLATLTPEIVNDTGVIGIMRILVLAPFGYAVFFRNILELPLPQWTVRAGTLASIALAGLLVTAQVAQNFLTDGFGLLLGGVVAGLVVFAAVPLQRLAERTIEARRDVAEGADSPAARYRRQVEVAWVDGSLAANERLMLAEARRQLRLSPQAAHDIDEEVAATQAKAARKGAA